MQEMMMGSRPDKLIDEDECLGGGQETPEEMARIVSIVCGRIEKAVRNLIRPLPHRTVAAIVFDVFQKSFDTR